MDKFHMSFSYNPFPETNIPALPNHAAIIVVGGGGGGAHMAYNSLLEIGDRASWSSAPAERISRLQE